MNVKFDIADVLDFTVITARQKSQTSLRPGLGLWEDIWTTQNTHQPDNEKSGKKSGLNL